MHRFSVLSFALVLVGFAAITTATAQDYSYVAQRLAEIESAIGSAHSPSMIIIGDSITEREPWPPQVCGLTIINGGASGSRTSYMLPLVDEFLRLQYHPAAIVIATGMNDAHKMLWRDRKHEATFLSSYRAMVQSALNATANVLLATISPVDFDAPMGASIDQSARETLNNDIREIATQFHLQVVDTGSLKSTEPLTIDGVHFTEDGKRLYLERILAAVRTQMCSSNFPLP